MSCAEEPAEEVEQSFKPKPPFVGETFSSTRLVLRYHDGRFEVVSSSGSYGGATQAKVDEAVLELTEGRTLLAEYVALGADGERLARGYFLVPLTTRATFSDADDPTRIHHVEAEDPDPHVRVAIPYTPDLAAVEFRTATPQDDGPWKAWPMEPAGTVRVEPIVQREEGES